MSMSDSALEPCDPILPNGPGRRAHDYRQVGEHNGMPDGSVHEVYVCRNCGRVLHEPVLD